MVRQVRFLCLVALLSSTAAALAQEVPVTDCDRYAAEADDTERRAPGVSDDDLNSALAVPACERAVEQFPTSRRLVFQLGRAYLNGANLSGAVVRFHQAAEQGHVLAQTYLGTLYLEGTGVAKDDAQALLWFRKSAEQGDAVAQFNLAVMQESGRGAAKDDAQAAAWYRKSADQGFSLAQSSLGRMYASGRGVPKDDIQAAAWFRKAADQGDASGQYRLAGLYADGRGVPKDAAQAIAWYRKAADKGYLDAAKQAATLEAAASAKPAATEAPAPVPTAGSERTPGRSQWLLRIMLSVNILFILATAVFLLLRRRGQQRSVARQLESLKLEARKAPEKAPEEDPKVALESALNSFASQIEAIPALPPDPDAEVPAKPEAGEPESEKLAADDEQPAPTTPDDSAKAASDDSAKAASDDAAKEAKEQSDAVPQFVAEAIDQPEPAPPAMKRCSQCQKEIPPNDYFCCHCGALAIRFSDCQHDVRDNARFCPRCGAILRWSTPKATAELPPAET